jgi:hypothetical protein
MHKRFTEEDIEEFRALIRPLIQWLNSKCNPHMKVIVDSTFAELVSSEFSFSTEEFLKD